MKLIESRDNPVVKTLMKLARGVRRDGSVLLEGVHLCQSWLAVHGQPDHAIFDHAKLDRPEIAAIADQVLETRATAFSPALMRSLAEVPSGQGVAFLVTPPSPMLPARLDENAVLLDRIQDPGNVGTLLRSCAAAGVKRVFLATGSAQAWSPKVLRSGQGAHFCLDIHEHVDALELLARTDIPVVATSLAQAEDLYQCELPRACLWVFGHEGQGVSATILAGASIRVTIPHDPAVESLNVAMAATLCLFEQRRRHR